MTLPKLNSDKLVYISLKKYKIDWAENGASKLEKKTKDFLRPFWQNCLCGEQVRIPGSLLRIDIVNFTKKICIEISPESHHGKFNPFFHKGNRLNYKNSILRDMQKQTYIEEKMKYKYIELNEDDVNNLSRKMFSEKFNLYL